MPTKRVKSQRPSTQRPMDQREERQAAGGKLRSDRLPSTDFVPRTHAQVAAKAALDSHHTIFLVGPAGTAKTTLAAAQAVDDMRAGRARKIILARAAIDAEEGGIGFMPGTAREKMEIWCRAMIDALGLFYGKALVKTMLDQELIELMPPTMMRGQSINHATVIIDEFQNVTAHLAKLLLTRIGDSCRMVLTCDPEQIDLPPNKVSAVEDYGRFEGAKGVAFFDFGVEDVTRSEACRTILECYEKR